MKLKLSKEKWEFAKRLGIEDRDYTQEELDDIVIEALADELMMRGFTDDQQDVNEIGAMCESIIDDVEDQR